MAMNILALCNPTVIAIYLKSDFQHWPNNQSVIPQLSISMLVTGGAFVVFIRSTTKMSDWALKLYAF